MKSTAHIAAPVCGLLRVRNPQILIDTREIRRAYPRVQDLVSYSSRICVIFQDLFVREIDDVRIFR